MWDPDEVKDSFVQESLRNTRRQQLETRSVPVQRLIFVLKSSEVIYAWVDAKEDLRHKKLGDVISSLPCEGEILTLTNLENGDKILLPKASVVGLVISKPTLESENWVVRN